MAVPFCIPTNNESSCCSTFPAFGVISVLGFKHSNSGVVISHGCLNLYFPDGMWCVEHLFKCLFAICLSSFLGYLTLFFSRLFTFLLLKLKSSLYILDCIPLSNVSFAKIFSSLFFALSFSEQKLIILIKSSVTSISAWIVLLRLHLKSHYPWWPLDEIFQTVCRFALVLV